MKQNVFLKKIVNFAYNIFLLFVLLLVFSIPIIVSFNLDPELASIESNYVKGAADSRSFDNLIPFKFYSNDKKSSFIKEIISTEKEKFLQVRVKFDKNLSSSKFEKIGFLANNSGSNNISINLIDNLNNKKSKIIIKIEDSEFVLKENDNYFPVKTTIQNNTRKEIFIKSEFEKQDEDPVLILDFRN